ncbi:MAG: glycosyltransferase family 4 protein [Candidatus Aminicenantaceae bacterium]
MRIFIHTMYYLPEFGSAPILMKELADYLRERGHEVEVITTIPRPPHHKKYRGLLFASRNENGITVRRYRTNFTVHHIGRLIAWTLYTGWSYLNLRRRVQKGDVLFLRLPPLQLGWLGKPARQKKKAGVLLSVQDIHPDLSIESGLLRKTWAIDLAQKFEKWIYRQADAIAVISGGFRENLLSKGAAPRRLHIVPNWVDTDFLRPRPRDNPMARKYEFDRKFTVMYSGTISLSSYVTLKKAVEAAALMKEDPDFLLAIIGEGLKKPDLVNKAKELGLDNVVFLPFQPYEDLPEMLASADVLLVPLDPTKTQLSVPSKLYNYMSAGRAVLGLTGDDSEVADILRKSGGGWNVGPDDVEGMKAAFQNLMRNPEKCREKGENARRYIIQNYSKDVVLKRYEDLMMRTVSGE